MTNLGFCRALCQPDIQPDRLPIGWLAGRGEISILPELQVASRLPLFGIFGRRGS